MSTHDAKVVWITGGGTGIGAASARRAASAGWSVALSGRRADALNSVVENIKAEGGFALALPLDVADQTSVALARDIIVQQFGRIDAVLLAAGLNTPRRRWADQSMEEFDAILKTNLVGPAMVIDAALPQLRAHHGIVVIVSSYSAWAFNPIAGVAYSASKKGLAELARTLNAQEAAAGVRACHLCPGDVATDFLQHRPNVPDAAVQADMLTPDDIGRTVQFVLDSPSHVRFDEIVISPLSQK